MLSILPLCTIYLLDFGKVPTVGYFSIGFWNCSDGGVFFYWILEMFRWWDIFLLDFGTVQTVGYICIGFWNCSDGGVFFYWILGLFKRWGIFLLDFGLFIRWSICLFDFGTVQTVGVFFAFRFIRFA